MLLLFVEGAKGGASVFRIEIFYSLAGAFVLCAWANFCDDDHSHRFFEFRNGVNGHLWDILGIIATSLIRQKHLFCGVL